MRLEYKYLVPNKYLEKLRADLQPFIEYDEYALGRKNDEYTVRSIYFDNRKLDYYNEKIDGIKVRKKLRIRGYNTLNGNNIVFLEIKRKNENFISKNRSPLYFENLNTLLESGNLEEYILCGDETKGLIDDGKKFFYHYIHKSLRPTSLVVYEREPFFCKFDRSIRITFDKNLRYMGFPKISELFEDNRLKQAMTNYVILEIKFYKGFPEWLQNFVTKYFLIRQTVSKYVICIDAYSRLYPLNNNIREAFSKPVFIQN